MSIIEVKGFSIYDLALKDTLWSRVLQYPLAVIFLIDHHLNWKHIETELRGDFACNISSGLAKISGIIGVPLRIICRLMK